MVQKACGEKRDLNCCCTLCRMGACLLHVCMQARHCEAQGPISYMAGWPRSPETYGHSMRSAQVVRALPRCHM